MRWGGTNNKMRLTVVSNEDEAAMDGRVFRARAAATGCRDMESVIMDRQVFRSGNDTKRQLLRCQRVNGVQCDYALQLTDRTAQFNLSACKQDLDPPVLDPDTRLTCSSPDAVSVLMLMT